MFKMKMMAFFKNPAIRNSLIILLVVISRNSLVNLINNTLKSFFIKFIKQFNDIMIIILIISALVSAIVTKIEGAGDYLDSIIIISIVVLNALMGLFKSLKLKNLLKH